MSAKIVPPLIRTIHCAPKHAPCPRCGLLGVRKRTLDRQVRSIAYRRLAFLHVFYGEYDALCDCCKSFRNHPTEILPRVDYDIAVRHAVLDRLLEDGLNVERTRVAMKRDFFLDLSTGFIYDCLDWQLRQINLPEQRRLGLEQFSGVLCIDELHLGKFIVLLATDPIADRVVGFAQVKVNDQAHMRRFLLALKYWGFLPSLVVSDGSNLYPSTLAEVWPTATHQLCVFHIVQDINKKILDALRRLRMGQSRRGNGGRKRKRGRPSRQAKKRRSRRGPTNKEKAAFVFKHRYLIVKRLENLSTQERVDLQQMFAYLPGLRVLHQFSQEVYTLWDAEQSRKVARWRWTRMKGKEEYKEVPALQEILEWLDGEKFQKSQAFLEQPEGKRVKTNNHVERTNRKLRFDEKVRYKWRKRKSVVRFILLRIDRYNAPNDNQVQPPSKPSKVA